MGWGKVRKYGDDLIGQRVQMRDSSIFTEEWQMIALYESEWTGTIISSRPPTMSGTTEYDCIYTVDFGGVELEMHEDDFILIKELPLKLYVWTKVLEEYNHGIAFALAETKDEAIEMLLLKYRRNGSIINGPNDDDIFNDDEVNTEEFEVDLRAEEPKVFESKMAYYMHGSA